MKPRSLIFLAFALVLTLGALPLHAMFDAFLKIEGVPGESSDTSHKDWIEVLSYSHAALSQGTRSATGGAGSGRLSISSLTLTKKHDKATPKLYEAATKGTHYPSVILHVRKAGGGSHEYLEYKLENVMITSYQLGATGKGGAQPTESLSINFAKIELVYKGQGNPPAGQVQGAAALSKAGAVTPPTPTATPGRPAAAAPKR